MLCPRPLESSGVIPRRRMYAPRCDQQSRRKVVVGTAWHWSVPGEDPAGRSHSAPRKGDIELLLKRRRSTERKGRMAFFWDKPSAPVKRLTNAPKSADGQPAKPNTYTATGPSLTHPTNGGPSFPYSPLSSDFSLQALRLTPDSLVYPQFKPP